MFSHCIRLAVLEGKTYPCAELILTPPATPDPVLINEGMVSNMLNEYKSHFPTDTSESRMRSWYKLGSKQSQTAHLAGRFLRVCLLFYAWNTSFSMGHGILIFRGPWQAGRDIYLKIISQIRLTSSSARSAYSGKVNTRKAKCCATGVFSVPAVG